MNYTTSSKWKNKTEDVRCDGPILNGALISDSGRKLLANDVPASQNRLALTSFISLFFTFISIRFKRRCMGQGRGGTVDGGKC